MWVYVLLVYLVPAVVAASALYVAISGTRFFLTEAAGEHATEASADHSDR